MSSSAESGGPFSDDTIINFSGMQTATPTASENPYTNATSNSAAALGGNAATEDAATSAQNLGGSVGGIPVMYLVIGGSVLVAGVIGFVILKKKKII